MIFYTVIDHEIIFHLVYNMLKFVENCGQKSLEKLEQKPDFCNIILLNDVVYILLPGAMGDISLAGGGGTGVISPTAKKAPDITLTLVNLHNIWFIFNKEIISEPMEEWYHRYVNDNSGYNPV